MTVEEVQCITQLRSKWAFHLHMLLFNPDDLHRKFHTPIFPDQLSFFKFPVCQLQNVLGLAWKFIKPQNITLTQTANCFAHKQGLLLQEQEFWQFYQVPIKNQSNQSQSRNLHIVDFTLVTVKKMITSCWSLIVIPDWQSPVLELLFKCLHIWHT